MINRAIKDDVIIAPVDWREPSNFGVFAGRGFKKGEVIFENGPFNVSHAEFCAHTNVLYEGEGQTFKINKGKNWKPRHVYEFLQGEKAVVKPDHVGHSANSATKWVDLKKTLSPAVFINSILPGDHPVKRNTDFTVYTDGNDEVSAIFALRDIRPFEELLGNYLVGSEDGPKKQRKRNADNDKETDAPAPKKKKAKRTS